MKKMTIKDVAEALGLSPGTVSKVVNNSGRVGDKTRKRVKEYVKKHGYVASANARILKSRLSFTIGVIFSDISHVGLEHPFFASILQSFKTAVEERGYEIVFIVSRVGENELTYYQWCRNKKVDGVLIVMGNINNPNIQEVVQSEIPCVSTDIVMDNLQSVISDDKEGVRLALDHAENLGCEQITHITGPTSSRGFAERAAAFSREMEERGLPLPDEAVEIAEGFGFTSGYNATLKHLKKVARPPELILAGSDELAFGIVRALESKRLRVPEDIMVMGYDDIKFAKHFTPSLSTIRQNKEKIGRLAAERLLSAIEERRPKRKEITKVPVELVKRQSTGRG